MKLTTVPSLTLAAALSTAAFAQTAPRQAVHPAAPHSPSRQTPTASTGCYDLPKVSDKIPALPAGTPCPKALLVITSHPGATLDYVSPLVTPEVREALGLAPTTFALAYSEIQVGTGPLAAPDKWYTVKYTGWLRSDGTKFDSSEDHPDPPFAFKVGAHQVIPGWDLGTQGMHIGGKRRLYVPWQFAYGDRGNPPRIPSKADLVFDIEIVSQSDNKPEAPKPAPAPEAAKPAPPASAPAASGSSGAGTIPAPAAAPASPQPKPAAPTTTAPASNPPKQ